MHAISSHLSKVTFLLSSKRRSSPLLWRNQDSMLPTPAHTDLSPTCRYCKSSWSASSSASWWNTWCLLICHYCSLVFDGAIWLKLLFCRCCWTSSKLSTVVTWLPWSFWICLQPSTQSTTPSFCRACRRASISAKMLTAGFSHTCLATASAFAADLLGRLLPIWCVAYHRVRADIIRALHRRPDLAYRKLQFVCWFSLIESFWVRRCHLDLDEMQQIVVCDRTPSASTTSSFCSTDRWPSYHPSTVPLFVHDLGIYIDVDLLIRTHVQRTVSRCFAALHQLCQIRRCVPVTMFQMLIVALVHSWLDYSNSVLFGIPSYLLRRLQSVLNAAARLIFHLKRSNHITDAVVSLHWLRVQERIQYKVAVLGYRVLHGSTPRFLGPLTHVADVPGRQTQTPPITSSCRPSNSPLLAAELFRLLLPPSGTCSLNTSSVHLLYSHFNIIWKPSCSNIHFRTFFCN